MNINILDFAHYYATKFAPGTNVGLHFMVQSFCPHLEARLHDK